jgi:hypothetical protein
MPHDQNVAELVRILIAAGADYVKRSGDPPDPIHHAKWLAERLASEGVLVPSALTEDEAVKIGADAAGAVPADRAEIALCVRQGLERIAKGE